MRSPALAVLGLVLLGASVLTPLGGATSPGRNGRIAYMLKDGADHWQVWVASSRLTNPKKLTNGAADSGWAVWSPDGKMLAFDSNRSDPDPNDADVINDVFSVRPDGTDVTMLTDSKGLSGEPAWSPDGALIAMQADRGDPVHGEGIYVMNADGTNLRRVTVPPTGSEDGKPRFSPSGKQLVFTRFRGKDLAEKAAVFTVSLDGTHLRRLTTFAIHADDLDWSPTASASSSTGTRTQAGTATSTSSTPTVGISGPSRLGKPVPPIPCGPPTERRSSFSTTASSAAAAGRDSRR